MTHYNSTNTLNYSTTTLNYSNIFYTLFGIIPLGLLFPTWIVAKYIWLPLKEKTKRELELLPNMEVPYEYTYSPENAGNTNKNYDGLMKSYVMEQTPDGYVILRWNKSQGSFEFWSDKTISYKYLEVVARKYIITFSCKDIYINRGELLKEKLKKLKELISQNLENKEKDEDKDNTEEESVFASLKTQKNKKKLKTRIERDDVVCETANKYLNKGKLNECDFCNVSVQKEKVKEISFTDWKYFLIGSS